MVRFERVFGWHFWYLTYRFFCCDISAEDRPSPPLSIRPRRCDKIISKSAYRWLRGRERESCPLRAFKGPERVGGLSVIKGRRSSHPTSHPGSVPPAITRDIKQTSYCRTRSLPASFCQDRPGSALMLGSFSAWNISYFLWKPCTGPSPLQGIVFPATLPQYWIRDTRDENLRFFPLNFFVSGKYASLTSLGSILICQFYLMKNAWNEMIFLLLRTRKSQIIIIASIWERSVTIILILKQ